MHDESNVGLGVAAFWDRELKLILQFYRSGCL